MIFYSIALDLDPDPNWAKILDPDPDPNSMYCMWIHNTDPDSTKPLKTETKFKPNFNDYL